MIERRAADSAAKEWLRRWHAIGGRARNGRSGFVLHDTRHDESVSFPLMAELRDPELMVAVKHHLRPPFVPPARRWLPYTTGRFAPGRLRYVAEDFGGMPSLIQPEYDGIRLRLARARIVRALTIFGSR